MAGMINRVWESYELYANYNNQATVKIVGIEYHNPYRYIVEYKEKVFLADINKVKLIKK